MPDTIQHLFFQLTLHITRAHKRFVVTSSM